MDSTNGTSIKQTLQIASKFWIMLLVTFCWQTLCTTKFICPSHDFLVGHFFKKETRPSGFNWSIPSFQNVHSSTVRHSFFFSVVLVSIPCPHVYYNILIRAFLWCNNGILTTNCSLVIDFMIMFLFRSWACEYSLPFPWLYLKQLFVILSLLQPCLVLSSFCIPYYINKIFFLYIKQKCKCKK